MGSQGLAALGLLSMGVGTSGSMLAGSSSASGQIWLANSTPGAVALDVAVCPSGNNSLVLSSVCRQSQN